MTFGFSLVKKNGHWDLNSRFTRKSHSYCCYSVNCFLVDHCSALGSEFELRRRLASKLGLLNQSATLRGNSCSHAYLAPLPAIFGFKAHSCLVEKRPAAVKKYYYLCVPPSGDLN